jgi:hypothetical protein
VFGMQELCEKLGRLGKLVARPSVRVVGRHEASELRAGDLRPA